MPPQAVPQQQSNARDIGRGKCPATKKGQASRLSRAGQGLRVELNTGEDVGLLGHGLNLGRGRLVIERQQLEANAPASTARIRW